MSSGVFGGLGFGVHEYTTSDEMLPMDFICFMTAWELGWRNMNGPSYGHRQLFGEFQREAAVTAAAWPTTERANLLAFRVATASTWKMVRDALVMQVGDQDPPASATSEPAVAYGYVATRAFFFACARKVARDFRFNVRDAWAGKYVRLALISDSVGVSIVHAAASSLPVARVATDEAAQKT